MCGRFALIVDASVLADVFDVDPPRGFAPRFNIAPTQTTPVVRAGAAAPRECAMVRWGLVPSWARDESIGARMINARAETVGEKPSFRSALRARRCLVPASGFYEWQKTGGGTQPHFIRFTDERLFAFAGLWERWSKGAGPPLESFAIITTEPNPLLAQLHDRMPVILDPAVWGEWLEPQPLPAARLQEMLSPHPAKAMEARPVGRYVNSPRNEGPRCIEPPA